MAGHASFLVRQCLRAILAAACVLFAGTLSPHCRAQCDQWQPVGGSSNSFIRALSSYNGDLIVGGDLTSAGGVPANRIARWNGEEWHALGDGLNGTVYALATFNGDLVAGGSFTQAGGEPALYVARWDGNDWNGMGDQFNGVVHTLFVHEGQLLAGGDFSMHLAQWDGARWQTFATPLSGSVAALAEYNSDLIVAGSFSTANGMQVNNIARWDGAQWHALNSPGHSPGTGDGARALHVHDGDLYVGGFFQVVGGESMRGIARWDGTHFHPLGEGVMSYVFTITSLDSPRGDLLVAGGAFVTAGTLPANNIAAWDGRRWMSLDIGTNAAVNAAHDWNGEILAGGFFTQAGGDPQATYLAGFTACLGPVDCIADINGSNAVDIDDLLMVISTWGECPAPPEACPADIWPQPRGDDSVNIQDLLAVIGAWGACP
jgi:hypothetical protein